MADHGGAALAKDEHKYYKITFDHLTQERAEREKLLEEGQAESEESKKTAVYAHVIIEKSLIVDVDYNNRNPKTFGKVKETVHPSEEKAAAGQDKTLTEKKLEVEIKNTGNIALFITKFEECDLSGKCQNKGWFKQLFPQERYAVSITDDVTSVRYVERSGEHNVDRFLAVRK